MKLTELSAAWLPAWTCRLMPAPAGSDAGTASQLIPGVIGIVQTGLSMTLACLVVAGCRPGTTPEASPSPREKQVADVAIVPEQQREAPADCDLADYPVSAPTHVQALMAGQGAGETGQKLSHMVLVRYRQDETGAITHLKLVRPSSYGVKATAQALAMLKARRLSPVIVGGKAQAACADAAITIHLR